MLNALGGRAAAIVSAQAGTTRDYVSTTIELDGVVCSLVDTAGVDPHRLANGLDLAARNMAMEQIEQAHLRLICLDASQPFRAADRQLIALQEPSDSFLVVLTKVDLPRQLQFNGETWLREAVHTSSSTGIGLAALKQAIRARLVGGQGSDAVVASTAARCRESLRLTADSLRRARDVAISAAGDEFVAAELRVALDELGKVVGATYTDDILDRIFSRFCIGK